MSEVRIIGIDPGLRRTGWGVVRAQGSHLSYVGCGTLTIDPRPSLAERLAALSAALLEVLAAYAPDEAAVEETFVNRNPRAALSLGQARGVCLLAPASTGLLVSEYAPSVIKKAVTGTGSAQKTQVGAMVATLLPGADIAGEDASDALAAAICHASCRGHPVLRRAS